MNETKKYLYDNFMDHLEKVKELLCHPTHVINEIPFNIFTSIITPK